MLTSPVQSRVCLRPFHLPFGLIPQFLADLSNRLML